MLKPIHSLAVNASMLPPMNRLRGQFFPRCGLRPFEHHVLDKMGDAVPLQVFVAGTGLDPYPDRGRAEVLHFLSDKDEAIGKDLATDVADFLNRPSIVARSDRVRQYEVNLL